MKKKIKGFEKKRTEKHITHPGRGKTRQARTDSAAKRDFIPEDKKNSEIGSDSGDRKERKPFKTEKFSEKNKYQSDKTGMGAQRDYKGRSKENTPRSDEHRSRRSKPQDADGSAVKRPFGARPVQKKNYNSDKVSFESKDEQKEHKPYKTPGAYREYKKNKDLVRLNKYISNAGYCSRREADTLITAGSVTVDGEIVTELGYKVNPGSVVKIDNQTIRQEKLRYILLNKPKDVITTCDDPQGRMTVLNLIKGACKERVYPVGRLDRNTTGLLIMTNDGDFAKKIAHPSSKVKKLYEVTLDKKLKQEHFDEISKGVWLDENSFVDVDDLAFVEGPKTGTVIGIEIHSGKNHVVKRIFEKFGYMVVKLDRTKIDVLTKKDLPRGRWRFMTESEIQLLKRH